MKIHFPRYEHVNVGRDRGLLVFLIVLAISITPSLVYAQTQGSEPQIVTAISDQDLPLCGGKP